MKLKLLALALIGSFAFTSCEKEEDKKVPKVTPSKKEVVDEFESLEDLLASQDTVTLIQKKGNASKPQIKSATSNLGIPTPGKSGRYVLQVAVVSSQKKTDRILRKLKNLGYPAYAIEVKNPGQLEGSWNRIRIGQFKTVANARKFGHAILIPANFSFWVDLKKNDYKSGTNNSKAFESEDRSNQTGGNYSSLKPQTFVPVKPISSYTPKSSSNPSSASAPITPKEVKKAVVKEVKAAVPVVQPKQVAPVTPKEVKKAVVKEVKAASPVTLPKQKATTKKASEVKQSDWSASEGWE